MPRLRLRAATLRDLPLLVRHRRRMWEDMGIRDRAALDEADAVYHAWARERMRRGKLVGWIVEAAEGPVASGCVALYDVHPRPGFPGGDQPYLLSMFTEPAHRGKGLARRIVQAAIRWSRAEGYPRMTLHASDQGRPVYERLGFVRTWEMKLQLRDEVVARRRGQPRKPARARAAGSRSPRRRCKPS